MYICVHIYIYIYIYIRMAHPLSHQRCLPFVRSYATLRYLQTRRCDAAQCTMPRSNTMQCYGIICVLMIMNHNEHNNDNNKTTTTNHTNNANNKQYINNTVQIPHPNRWRPRTRRPCRASRRPRPRRSCGRRDLIMIMKLIMIMIIMIIIIMVIMMIVIIISIIKQIHNNYDINDNGNILMIKRYYYYY